MSLLVNFSWRYIEKVPIRLTYLGDAYEKEYHPKNYPEKINP